MSPGTASPLRFAHRLQNSRGIQAIVERFLVEYICALRRRGDSLAGYEIVPRARPHRHEQRNRSTTIGHLDLLTACDEREVPTCVLA